jgi:hypothetical protein
MYGNSLFAQRVNTALEERKVTSEDVTRASHNARHCLYILIPLGSSSKAAEML